jgi:hypothetical protein
VLEAAPAFLANSSRKGTTSVEMTFAPAALKTRMKSKPIGPAPRMTVVSPGWMRTFFVPPRTQESGSTKSRLLQGEVLGDGIEGLSGGNVVSGEATVEENAKRREVLALVRPPYPTISANPTGKVRSHHHPVARLELSYRLPDPSFAGRA